MGGREGKRERRMVREGRMKSNNILGNEGELKSNVTEDPILASVTHDIQSTKDLHVRLMLNECPHTDYLLQGGPPSATSC